HTAKVLFASTSRVLTRRAVLKFLGVSMLAAPPVLGLHTRYAKAQEDFDDALFRGRRFVNVREPRFGAKAEKDTDDRQAIQDAVNFAHAHNLGVWVPDGTYMIGLTSSKTFGYNPPEAPEETDPLIGIDLPDDTVFRMSSQAKLRVIPAFPTP